MEINQPSTRIHPLVAGAAVSVMVASLMGVAAMTGLLPNSHASAAQTSSIATQVPVVAPITAPVQQVAAAPAIRDGSVSHRPVVHHYYPVQHAQAQPDPQYSQAPVYQQPAPVAQNSPLGIGVGAAIGGLLGNQVGGGKGKTLATIAGVVGGGYLGNEIAKRNQ